MGRNNARNIKKHNDKLHKEQRKAKDQKQVRLARLSEISRKYHSENDRDGFNIPE